MESNRPISPQERDGARRRLNRVTLVLAGASASALAVFAGVAAATIPGLATAPQSTGAPSSTTSSSSSDSQTSSSSAGQPAAGTPQAASGSGVAVSGGSR
jgi:hypothetical protein